MQGKLVLVEAPRHQSVAVEQWVHCLNSLGANRVPVSTDSHPINVSMFQVVPSTVSPVH